MAWTAAAFRFPSIAHVCGSARHNHVVTMSEKHVATGENQTAVLNGRQVSVAAQTFHSLPIGGYLTKDSKPRYTAIRKDCEAKMSDTLAVVDRKGIKRIAGQRHLWKNRDPFY